MSIPEYVLVTRKKLAEMEYVCADTADRLKEVGNTLTGSKAIGHETMESAFRQMSKVVRNYMRAVDREIEDHSPGTVDDIYAALERMEQVSAKLKDRPEAPPRQEDDMFDTALLQDLIRENEPHAEAQRRWQSDYNQLLNRLVDSRLPALSPTEREYQRRLQAALYMGRVGAIETL